MHPGPASWRGGGQHNPAQHVGPDECDLLGNEAADREPEDIDAGNIQRGDESNSIAGHLLDMFKSLMPANDLEFRYGINAPTLRIEGLTLGGR